MPRPLGAAAERHANTAEEAFGRTVTQLRIEAKITQSDLAHALGYNLSYVGQIERGRKSPTLRTMTNIADYFKLPLSKLVALAEMQSKS